MSFNYTERLDKLKKAIWLNYSFLLKVADPYKNMFKLYKGKNGEVLMEPLLVEVKDIIKMRSTLRLFTRDWAIDGIDERSSTYKPILNELKKFFENKTKKEFQEGINILVPGAGLGRLMYEIAKLGFKSQGNEFSYYMLLCSNFIFNNTTKKDEFILQPFIHSFSNIFNEEDPKCRWLLGNFVMFTRKKLIFLMALSPVTLLIQRIILLNILKQFIILLK